MESAVPEAKKGHRGKKEEKSIPLKLSQGILFYTDLKQVCLSRKEKQKQKTE